MLRSRNSQAAARPATPVPPTTALQPSIPAIFGSNDSQMTAKDRKRFSKPRW
jgi:hypothetical protein